MEIRRLRSGDNVRLREVRLRALADAPYAFSSSFERESVLGPEFWEGRVAESDLGEDGVVFVAIDGEQSLGMAGGFFVGEERKVTMLWGMWVGPERAARRFRTGAA